MPNAMSMVFDTRVDPEPLPDKPLSPETLRELGFVHITRSSEADSFGSHSLQRAYFHPPSFKQLVEDIRKKAYDEGYRNAKREVRNALGIYTY